MSSAGLQGLPALTHCLWALSTHLFIWYHHTSAARIIHGCRHLSAGTPSAPWSIPQYQQKIHFFTNKAGFNFVFIVCIWNITVSDDAQYAFSNGKCFCCHNIQFGSTVLYWTDKTNETSQIQRKRQCVWLKHKTSSISKIASNVTIQSLWYHKCWYQKCYTLM